MKSFCFFAFLFLFVNYWEVFGGACGIINNIRLEKEERKGAPGIAIVSFYGSAATVLNTHYGFTVLPVGQPFGSLARRTQKMNVHEDIAV